MSEFFFVVINFLIPPKIIIKMLNIKRKSNIPLIKIKNINLFEKILSPSEYNIPSLILTYAYGNKNKNLNVNINIINLIYWFLLFELNKKGTNDKIKISL